jgi:ABC-type xylose transport system permease subunit
MDGDTFLQFGKSLIIENMELGMTHLSVRSYTSQLVTGSLLLASSENMLS